MVEYLNVEYFHILSWMQLCIVSVSYEIEGHSIIQLVSFVLEWVIDL